MSRIIDSPLVLMKTINASPPGEEKKKKKSSSSSSSSGFGRRTRALERVFIFALGSIAGFTVLDANERHDRHIAAETSTMREMMSEKNQVLSPARELMRAAAEKSDEEDGEARRMFVDLDDSNNNASKKTGGTKQPRDKYNTKRDDDDDDDDDVDSSSSSSSSYYYYWASNITADVRKQDEIREAMRASYGAYEKYAFGFDEIQPKSLHGSNNQGGVSASVIDAIDTLHVMNLKEEYERARAHLLLDKKSGLENLASARLNQGISVFETNIRILGGLLSIYDLTSDEKFLERAVQVANAIAPAFDTNSGIPYTMINPFTKQGECFSFYQNSAVLADAGTLQLEFFTLADRTKDRKWYEYAKKTMDVILSYTPSTPNSIMSPSGLYPLFINPNTGKFTSDKSYAVGALGDSFYEYLIKSWRAFPNAQNRSKYRIEFDKSMHSVLQFMVSKFPKLTWQNGKELTDAWFLNDLKNGRQLLKMDHLACFISGALVLGAEHTSSKEIAREYLELAEHMTTLCRDFYHAQTSGLSPDVVVAASDSGSMYGTHNQNIQRPETVEAIFYMYRKTGDEKYRKWAWEIFQSMKQMYATTTGWTGIRDVRQATTSPQNRDDITQTFFFAETLKYLFLTFGSSDEINLNKWVFNTEAHPVKVSSTFTFPF